MSQAVAVRFNQVSIYRGGNSLLNSLSLEIPVGSLAVVLGPNGAGKSTFLKTITGELRPDEGSVEVLGEAIHTLGWRLSARLRRRIGAMPQLPEQAPAAPISARELVEISRAARHPAVPLLDANDARLCETWLARFGLQAQARRPYYLLSGGEQRKAHLARIFAQEPELILLDEPAGHLDLPAQDELIRVLSEVWHETRATLLIVAHDLRLVPPLCTHVLLLRKGRLLAMGSPEETLTDERLSALYGERTSVVKHAGRYLAVGSGRKEDSGHV